MRVFVDIIRVSEYQCKSSETVVSTSELAGAGCRNTELTKSQFTLITSGCEKYDYYD